MSKIFIGMPAYNGERFIREAIDSIINQTEKDWVLYISDDTSSDSTPEICKEYVKKDSRIKYYRQEKNLGMDGNFTFLLDHCDAPYFMWAGQDDRWRKNFLSICVNTLDTRNDVGVAFTGMINTDSYGRLIRRYNHLPKFSGKANIRTITKHIMSPEIMGKGNLMYALIRSDLAKKVNMLYPNKVGWGADVVFAFGIVAHGGVYIDSEIQYEKRHGGYSNPDSTKDDDPEKAKILEFKNPHNHMFTLKHFKQFLKDHLVVSEGTKFKIIIVILMYLRLLRAVYNHLKTRDYKKRIRSLMLKLFP